MRCSVTLESPAGVRFAVTQITGLIARRIVCHPEVGDFVRRGDRYGLIRFGSRTDVLLPLTARVLVGKGGLNGNVLRIKPPMCVTADDVDFALAVLDRALDAAEKV